MHRLIVLDPHPLVRMGICSLAARLPGWEALPLDPVALPHLQQAGPPVDAVVAGIDADTPESRDMLAAIRRVWSPTRILLLVDTAGDWPARALPGGGFFACVPRNAQASTLEAALRLCMMRDSRDPAPADPAPSAAPELRPAGRVPLHSGPILVSGALPEAPPMPMPQPAMPADAAMGFAARDDSEVPVFQAEEAERLNLTQRQYEVLCLLARGYPIKTVSRILQISPATAKAHTAALYQRLAVRNKTEAVYAARRRGALRD